MDDPNRPDIPDIGDQLPPPYAVSQKPAFTPPQEAMLGPAVTTWSTAAAPALLFGVPDGWTEVPADALTRFPVEHEHVPAVAPIVQATRILAAYQRPGDSGRVWSVQLRRYDGPLAEVVMQNPTNWARAKSSWCEFQGAIQRGPAGRPAIIMRYAYSLQNVVYVLYETWLLHGGGGYHFVLHAPAADEPRLWPDWEAMLASVRAGASQDARPGAPPPARPPPPVARYRCAVATQVPVTLGNVTSQRPAGLIIAGSPSLAAWSLLGVAAARLYGGVRARQLEGQTISVPATGDAMLTDDCVVLRLVVAPQTGRTTLKGGVSDRSVDLEIPYRLIGRWGSEQRGVWLDVVGRGALWLQPHDRGEFGQWLGHLSHGKTWQPPTRVILRAEAAVVGWCQQDPRFTFGLPDRWVPAPPEALASYGAFFHPSVLRAGVLLPADQWEAQVFVIDNGPADAVGGADELSLAAMLAAATDIVHNGPIEVTTLGGEPVALLRGYSWDAEGGSNDRCYGALAHGGTSHALWYGVVGGALGDGGYETWLPHFRTMLATWHWYQ